MSEGIDVEAYLMLSGDRGMAERSSSLLLEVIPLLDVTFTLNLFDISRPEDSMFSKKIMRIVERLLPLLNVKDVSVEVARSRDDVYGSIFYSRYRDILSQSPSPFTLAVDEGTMLSSRDLIIVIEYAISSGMICGVKERMPMLGREFGMTTIVCGPTGEMRDAALMGGIAHAYPFSGGVSFFSSTLSNCGESMHYPLGGEVS